MLSLLSLSTVAWADIAPIPPPDTQFTTYSVRVEGLAQFPDAVLVMYDKGVDTIRAYRPFSAEKNVHEIANGNRSRGNNFSTPDLFFLTAEAYAAWSAETNAEIARQRDACAESGEGCAHISRFVPRFAPPEGALPCGADVQIQTRAPLDAPDAYIDVFTVTAASPEGCTLTGPVSGAPSPPPSPTTPDAPPAASPPPDGPPPSAEVTERRCAAVTAAGGATWGLAMLLAGARRRR